MRGGLGIVQEVGKRVRPLGHDDVTTVEVVLADQTYAEDLPPLVTQALF
jgi:hypothetical protein